MDRRNFVRLLAAGMLGAAVGRSTVSPFDESLAASDASGWKSRAKVVSVRPAGVVPVPAPRGEVSGLPGEGTTVALTIDDGTSAEVVEGYVTLAARTGIRLTFFPNGCYRSWTDHAPALRPLIESGQVALGNHTWSHPDLTTLGDQQVADEITRADDFLRDTFGVRSSPFMRPPFGAHNDRVDQIAADLGHPTIAMWNGTLGDDTLLTADQLLANARQWFLAQHIVIGHANHPAVTQIYPQLMELLDSRQLQTVTLADVWSSGS